MIVVAVVVLWVLVVGASLAVYGVTGRPPGTANEVAEFLVVAGVTVVGVGVMLATAIGWVG